MFHPNIYIDGSICLGMLALSLVVVIQLSCILIKLPADILQKQWSPLYDIAAILTSIQSLLCDPNPDSPANSEASRLFVEEKASKYYTLGIIYS